MKSIALTILSLSVIVAWRANANCPSSASVLNSQPYAQGQSQLVAECTTVIQMNEPHGQPDLCVYSGIDNVNGQNYFLYAGPPGEGWDSKAYENNKVMNTTLSISANRYVGTFTDQCGDFGLHNCTREVVSYDKRTQRLSDEYDNNESHLPGLFTKWVATSTDIFGCMNAN